MSILTPPVGGVPPSSLVWRNCAVLSTKIPCNIGPRLSCRLRVTSKSADLTTKARDGRLVLGLKLGNMLGISVGCGVGLSEGLCEGIKLGAGDTDGVVLGENVVVGALVGATEG